MSGAKRWMKGVLSVVVIAVLTLSVLSATLQSARMAQAAPGAAPVAPASITPASTSVAPTLSSLATTSAVGPHPNVLDIYENAGGGTTMDPASAYNTINAEPIWNVYETLVAYNGTDDGSTYASFVPQLATCVPGSPECVSQFGSNLTFPNATDPANTQYYTFEIDANARFYDPNTSASWPVYPSDVVFSLARSLAFEDLPFLEAYPGWIQGQSMLPPGNAAWDSAYHYPYNNTPTHIMSAMLVNDSKYCPAPKDGLKTNGCITFDVGGSGFPWPNFLQFMADPMGAGIVPCGKFTYVGAPVPGFNGTLASKGDGSCTLPYGATSTSQSSFTRYLASLTPTAWDAYEYNAGLAYPSAQPKVQWQLFGSGPYYVYEVSASTGYFLRANPDYAAPVGCAGQTGCLPEPGHYIPTVNVYWDEGDVAGLEAMAGGEADYANLFPADFGALQTLVSSGKYGLIQDIPTLSFFFAPFELNFSTTAEAQIDSTGLLNVPGDWFSNVAIREFMVNAMPYNTLINYVYTSDGIATGEAYGGVIPHGMGDYYPLNVTWPSGNPVSNPTVVGNVTWWWKEATTPGSQWYDPQAAQCTSSHPCQFPIISLTGFSVYDDQANLWIASIKSLSGGDLQPYLLDIPPTTEAVSVGLPAGQGNMPDYPYGWAPDYPDPTDNIPTMFGPTGTYTVPDAVSAQLLLPQYMNPTAVACAGHTTDLSSFAELVYWANVGQVPNACQGFAFTSMADWIPVAGHNTNVTARTLEYNLIEHIANELALYMYSNQGVDFYDYASWINPAGINLNPMIGGGGDQLWSFWSYASAVYSVNVTESGLPIGTTWSATLGANTTSAVTTGTSSTITFTGLHNSTYDYSVSFVKGYSVSPSNGTVTVSGANATKSVTYTAITAPTVPVFFNETGLISNTSWTLVVNGYGGLTSSLPGVVFDLPVNTTYDYRAVAIPGYTAPAPGRLVLANASTSVGLAYLPVTVATYAVTFAETGLPAASNWTVSIGPAGSAYNQTTNTSSTTFYEPNGSYPVAFTLPTGYVAPASATSVVVKGHALVVTLHFVLAKDAFELKFTEKGLPRATLWNVTIANLTVNSTTTTLSFNLANATYDWTVTTIAGYIATTVHGTSTVDGATVTVDVEFVLYTYVLTFYEGGLPIVTPWNVTIEFNATNSTTYSTTAYDLPIDLPNGTYNFTVAGPAGYLPSPAKGNVTVNGTDREQVIIFGPIPETFEVTFTTATLPTGASWTVYFGDQSTTSASTTIAFKVTNGTWTYAVTSPTGYTASPTGGQLVINGAGDTVAVSFAAVSTSHPAPAWTYLSSLAYIAIGVLAVLMVIGFALAAAARGRRPPASPPESWTEANASKTGDTGTSGAGTGNPPAPPPA